MVPEDERILIGDARTVTQGSAPLSNLGAALALLGGLHRHGLRHVVLCPGSRSGPLAVAAGALRAEGVRLHTAIDERSAAFFALGLARVEGWPAAVVTTSGTAVANLLPAAVEADHGSLPLLLLTADRPARLKGCGANQSVNQERFLIASCRWQGLGDPRGLAFQTRSELERLAEHAMERAMGQELGEAGRMPPGPVHLNLPFEDPLHARPAELLDLGGERAAPAAAGGPGPRLPPGEAASTGGAPGTGEVLDPDRPGVVVAGPWRGLPHTWRAHLEALRRWQQRSGWPVLADPLSGLRGEAGLELVAGYDLLLARGPGDGGGPAEAQVLRLGPLPASRRLQDWLSGLDGRQVLVSEADPRPLDPLGRISGQFSGGLEAWVRALASPGSWSAPDAAAVQLAHRWLEAEARVQRWLDGKEAQAAGDRFEEPWLARQLSRLLPAGLPLMLANSSPVRDWETFAACGPARPVLGFRGASGIDGTLSIACGAAEAHGALVLVCGDLALLHDSNGWLWHQRLGGRLTVILIDNGGGGIFEQLPIRADPGELLDFETLFAMPQTVDPLALAAAHGVPGRAIGRPGELPRALSWALEQPMALLRVQTDRHADAALRRRLRTMAAREICPP